MKFSVETEFLAPIELDTYDHVTVILPDGRSVTVYADMIYVALKEERFAHKDGLKIWPRPDRKAG